MPEPVPPGNGTVPTQVRKTIWGEVFRHLTYIQTLYILNNATKWRLSYVKHNG